MVHLARKTVKPARLVAMACLIAGMLPLAGCRICADCEDLAYPAYGGAWQRTNRDAGRVGSIFDPGGARASELVSRETPPDPDELERDRQEARGGGISDPDRERDETDDATEDDKDKREDTDDLRDRKLDDIEEKMEDELRKKNLDDINVRLIPPPSMPARMR